jgi:hypothetical protein
MQQAIEAACGPRIVATADGADRAALVAQRDAAQKRAMCLIEAAGDRRRAHAREFWNIGLFFEARAFQGAMVEALDDRTTAGDADLSLHGLTPPPKN